MIGDISGYLGLVTSEHASKPNFIAVLSAFLQAFADNQVILSTLSDQFDVDTAVGVQLDAVGLWVGISRNLTVPLTGVYFSFDTSGVGWDEGVWQGPFDPTTGLVVLPDEVYRTLLKAKIAANQWDGTIPGAYAAYGDLFAPATVLIQDYGNMTMALAFIGTLTTITKAMLVNGLLDLVPAGVQIEGYYIPSVIGDPIFGFDCESSTIAGWDVGCWAIPLT